MRIDISAWREGNLQLPDFFYRVFSHTDFYGLMYALSMEECKVDKITVEIDWNINHESQKEENENPNIH